jgi:lipoate---protein ligase
VGALLAPGLVRIVEELYDYDVLRALNEPTLFSIRLEEPTLVLGGSQSASVLNEERTADVAVRRRRGGGGVVLLQPDDLWVDFWIPREDARWSADVHVASRMVGEWWMGALAPLTPSPLTVHESGLEGDEALRVACFAGRGPGEIFAGSRKVVGVTQWRVREGLFLSTVLHAHSSQPLLSMLAVAPDGLDAALDHHTIDTIGLEEPDLVVETLRATGPWRYRQLFLTK